MQTRRDQLQAYRFVTRRVMAALLHGEPDTPESPMRKLAVATFSGLMVAVLAVAAFGVWGLLRPGGAQSLEDPGTLIVEKDTGARYVFNQNDHKLYPVLNYTSARLILGSATITERQVSHDALTRYRRGATLGIPGAPDSLPAPSALIRRPWSVCSRVELSPSNNPRPIVTLLAGRDPGGARFGGDQAMVVQTPSRQFWVVWHNERMRADATAIGVFNIQREPQVGAAWLDALPAGPDFAPPRLTDLGSPTSFQINGVSPSVGQVFQADIVGGDSKYYVALPDGLAPIWQTEAALLFVDPRTRDAYHGQTPKAIAVDPATANTHLSGQSVSNGELPHTLPRATTLSRGDSTPLCATYPDPTHKPGQVLVTQGGSVPTDDQQAGSVAVGSVTDTGSVDQVVLPPGGGALAGLVPGSGQAGQVQTYYLITEQGDQGLKFPFRSADLVKTLGYDTSSAVPLPSNLLRLIQEGPILDPVTARTPVPVVPLTPSPSASAPSG
ncbi:MAG TPA: type VII secretion protein EccB [Mycobacteriales bacterium]|nr:type VII secretion protein EccB [Mycobacteriales bacterium]